MNTPEDLEIEPAGRGPLGRLSLVWVIPVIALVVSLALAWQTYANRGELIAITFENASGIVAGETVVKYRDVEVGLVEKVTFTDGLNEVLVSVRMDQVVLPYLDDDAEFWVVTPRVSVRGISGLDTVLAGVFIEGSWNTTRGTARRSFAGLAEPPLANATQRGTKITLQAKDGNQLADGAPVLHKGIKVGYIEEPKLTPAGDGVLVTAFIEAPFDRQITTATRFWDQSGFSVSLGASGVTLDVNSLASLVEGGIAFDTIVSGGDPLGPDVRFDIYPDEEAARESIFADPLAEEVTVSVLFEGSVAGLTADSDVRYRGIRVGKVTGLSAFVDNSAAAPRVKLLTNIAIQPGRLGLEEGATPEDALAYLSDFVGRGLRARLATGSLLTGSLVVELVELPDAPPAQLDLDAEPYPVLPTAPSEIADVTATAESVFAKINSLPIDEVLNTAIDTMKSIDALARDQALRDAPGAALALIDEARALVGSADVVAVPAELRASLAEINAILTQVQEKETVAKLVSAIESADTAAANIATASEDFPGITEKLDALAAKANALDLEGLAAEAEATLVSIDALIGSEDTKALPASVSGALDEVRLFLAELREGGAVENVNATLASATEAATAIENAANDLPEILTRLKDAAGQAETVLSAYGERSRFQIEALATLRTVQTAADAISALARAIQRNPNSLIMGR
ncbi:PqiB family protein [Actibacterium sp. D379-3]